MNSLRRAHSMISQLLPRRFPPFQNQCFRGNNVISGRPLPAFLASATPAGATTLLAVAITTAVTAQTTTPVQFLRRTTASRHRPVQFHLRLRRHDGQGLG